MEDNLYSKYYNKVSILKQNFEKILDKIQAEKNIENKVELANFALTYAVYNNTGYFTSSVLEKVFTDYAKELKADISDIHYKKNTVLHVLSEGYNTGGHTRVVERWIKNAPDSQIHSVVLTRPQNIKLDIIEKHVKEKNGECLYFDNNLSTEEKSIKLRELAMHYEYVILHIHMDDSIPTIAFGTEEFTRPILFYNHASHVMWLGKSIADMVLDIEENDEVTVSKRHISDTYFLGVPSEEITLSVCDKKEIRKKLNLPLNKKIIVTSGSEGKYRTICGHSFIECVKSFIDDDTYCYVIGVKPEHKEWKKAKKETGGHIIPLGFIDFNNGFLDYLKAADLYLDSYPFCGGTATIDAISSGTPALSLKSTYPQFDYLTKTSAYCKTKEEFIDKSRKVLNDAQYADKLFEELKNSLIEYQSLGAWQRKIEKLFGIAPKTHKVRDLSKETDYSESCDLSVLCNVMYSKKFLKNKKTKIMTDSEIDEYAKYGYLYRSEGIPYIFQINHYKKGVLKSKVYKLFNIKIVGQKNSKKP